MINNSVNNFISNHSTDTMFISSVYCLMFISWRESAQAYRRRGARGAIYPKTESFLFPVTLNPNPTGFPYCVDANPRESWDARQPEPRASLLIQLYWLRDAAIDQRSRRQ